MSKAWGVMALAAATAMPAVAQKVDLSGTWKLNLAKSFLAGDHPAKDYELTEIIVQSGNAIKQTEVAEHVSMMNIPLPDSKITTELSVDGKEHEVTIASGFPGVPPSPMKVVAEWQGGTLVVSESGRTFAGPQTTQRRYFLSEDGSELIELVEGHNVYGDTAQRMVFDK